MKKNELAIYKFVLKFPAFIYIKKAIILLTNCWKKYGNVILNEEVMIIFVENWVKVKWTIIRAINGPNRDSNNMFHFNAE